MPSPDTRHEAATVRTCKECKRQGTRGFVEVVTEQDQTFECINTHACLLRIEKWMRGGGHGHGGQLAGRFGSTS